MNIDSILSHSEVDANWLPFLREALSFVEPDYLASLMTPTDWLPGLSSLFAAFRLPPSKVRYILLGESPYPRLQSANGYAFWDRAVGSLWSEGGFSTAVNRATSLRNWLKALLVARGDLTVDLSQAAIAAVDKSQLRSTAEAFFLGLMEQGFLLLNASLVYSDGKVSAHAKQWRPFMYSLLTQLAKNYPDIELVLFGKIADNVPKTALNTALLAEHPYNLSFIRNPAVLAFFKPFDLLAAYE